MGCPAGWFKHWGGSASALPAAGAGSPPPMSRFLVVPACLPACLQGIPNGQEMELTTMIIECCSNEKTFIKCVSNNSSAWAGGPG